MSASDNCLAAALDEIEQREARLLSWGLVDAYLTPAELHLFLIHI